MRIGILVAGLPPEDLGGTELQAAQVAGLLSRNHQVTVWTRSQNRRSLLDEPRDFLVEIRKVINLPVARFPLDIFSTLCRIGRSRPRVDVIIAYQTVIDGLIGALARRLFKIPVLVFVRAEKEYKFHDFRKSKTFAPFVFKNADRIIVQSGRIKSDVLREIARYGPKGLAEIVRQKLAVIPNGVSSHPPRAANGDSILYVGRLVKGKGVECLISAMKRCPEERLVVVGDGPERRALELLAKNLTNVTFVGQVPPAGVSGYLQKARTFVLPSFSEGSPNVVLEAMAHGVPTIATEVGGIPDLIQHGETGFLTRPGNAEEIAHYIKKLAGDGGLRDRLATNCLRAIRRYSWNNVMRLYEDQLRGVVGDHRCLKRIHCQS
jgi:glycosyltransferase involved in cell wall biosynthesis